MKKIEKKICSDEKWEVKKMKEETFKDEKIL
jgi:hypothetical protein